MLRRLCPALFALFACCAVNLPAQPGLTVPPTPLVQPVNAPVLAVDDLKPGMQGEVWTVFRGTQPEPFKVQVTGVIRNALGPGKVMILCELTDPRVQNMGAVAGMSGSPLYIDGKFVGALSYQIQRFETVHYAGFTPAADLAEVQAKVGIGPPVVAVVSTSARSIPSLASGYQAMQPVFTLSGLSPDVAALFAPRFAALGLNAIALGGSDAASAGGAGTKPSSPPLQGGSAVSVALTTGDIVLAGTGSVSSVVGNHVTAFGHPMLGLGEVALPMCAADIVTILPSNLTSVKVANTGAVIGTIYQDRLSAISGLLGPGPEMINIEVVVASETQPSKTLRYAVIRQEQTTPMLVALGLAQAILGSNDSGLSNGFILHSDITFPGHEMVTSRSLYSGPQGFAQGIEEFVRDLSNNLRNPYEKTFPSQVSFTVEPLAHNPAITLDSFQLSRTTAAVGEVVQATLSWRDWQGESHRETHAIPVDAAWAGETLEVVLAPGPALDELTGRPRSIAAAQLRSFAAYLAAQRGERPADGLYLAVVEKTRLFTDQTVGTPDAPASIERIARAADEARFQQRDAVLPLWEAHVLPGKLSPVVIRRALRITE
ncbi:MAG: SpoIVB peptidase S55 domain-containing protein [Opitutaceae bacterium]